MKKPKMITKAEAEQIMLRLDERDRQIFRLSVETGLRISDVLKLKARQVDKIIYVQEQKTGKFRAVEITDELLAELEPKKYEHYGLRREIKLLCDTDKWLFRSPRDAKKHLHRSTYHRRLKRACKVLKIECSAHSTRKLYAVNLFRATKSIFEVQKALNHKYINTTAKYLDIDMEASLNQAATAALGGDSD
jgi:integrase